MRAQRVPATRAHCVRGSRVRACPASPSRRAACSPSGSFSARTPRTTPRSSRRLSTRASSICGSSWTGPGRHRNRSPSSVAGCASSATRSSGATTGSTACSSRTGRCSSAGPAFTAGSGPRRSRSATGSGRAMSGGGSRRRSPAALTRVAFERCGVFRVEIHIDPANTASLAVPAKLGYVREATLRKRLPPIRPGEERRDEVVFSLLEEEYPGSPSAAVAVEGLAWVERRGRRPSRRARGARGGGGRGAPAGRGRGSRR